MYRGLAAPALCAARRVHNPHARLSHADRDPMYVTVELLLTQEQQGAPCRPGASLIASV
jgi:hypothetical protein